MLKLYFELATKIVTLIGTTVCGIAALFVAFRMGAHPTDHQLIVLSVWILVFLTFSKR